MYNLNLENYLLRKKRELLNFLYHIIKILYIVNNDKNKFE